MKPFYAWVICTLLCVGCNVQVKPDVNKPKPTPDVPVVVVKKSPADSYYKGLAVFAEGHLVANPREMAQIVAQLVRLKLLTPEDESKLQVHFPGWLGDTNPFTDADLEKLRNLK